jgi:hypothetical protein
MGSAGSQTTATTSASTIVIQLRGVIALYNPDPANYPITHALLPVDRRSQKARDDASVTIPAHRPFIRFPMDGGFWKSSSRKPLEITHEENGQVRKYGVVFVDDEQLYIIGAAANSPGTSLYDRYTIDGAGERPTAEQRQAFHWVPKLGALCGEMRVNHRTNRNPTVDTLLTIDRGVLRSMSPDLLWRFEPPPEGGRTYTRAVAEGVSWEMEASGKRFEIWGEPSKGSLIFEVGKEPVEIGNYPEDLILMKEHPKPYKIDHHFELYYKFLKAPHPGKYHVPALATNGLIEPIDIKSSGGPSCGPGSLP